MIESIAAVTLLLRKILVFVGVLNDQLIREVQNANVNLSSTIHKV